MSKLETDVVVVAGGPAGLSAAIAAAEEGADVVVFEKANTTGGAGNMGMGPLGVETRVQKEKLVDLTVEYAFNKMMEYNHWRVDARLVRDYLEKSSETIEWLEDMGVEFYDATRYFKGSEASWHLVNPPSGRPGPRAAAHMFKLMTERAEDLGVEIYLETPVKKIIKENDEISGVIAESQSGETIEARGKSVVVATGGFGDNPDWIQKYTGFEWGKNLFSFRIPGVVGDGLSMAWEVGAGQSEIKLEMIYAIPYNMDYFALDAVFRQPNLVVNKLGERFMNEDYLENTTFGGNILSLQPECWGLSIFDERILKHYKKNGLDLVSLVHGADAIEGFDDDLQKAFDQGYEYVYVADSIRELAEQAGINSEVLEETVEDYNEACANNYDDLFYKDRRYLKPLKKPKFYAAKLFPGAYGSLGGIKINHRTEVLTDSFEVVPGLYAAGTDACSIYSQSYIFTLPGNTMGFAINSGRIAGENAAEYAQSID